MDVRTKQRLLPANIGKTKAGAKAASTLLGSKIIAKRHVDIAHGKVFLLGNLYFDVVHGEL